MKTKIVHAAMKVKWALSEVEETFCSKCKGKQTCFRWSAFMYITSQLTNHKMTFMELDSEVDQPIMKAELSVIIAEL